MRILVTGGGGQVGTAVAARARALGHDVRAPGHLGPDGCDVTDAGAVQAAVEGFGPEAVVHACRRAPTSTGAKATRPRPGRVNVDGTDHVASAAARAGAHLVHLSTDYVYDGTLDRPYVESDPVGPLSVYGATKLEAEGRAGAAATVVRTSWLSSPTGGVVVAALRAAREAGPLWFVDDQWGSPTSVEDLADVLVALAADRRPGTWHVANGGGASWCDVARRALTAAGLDPDRVEPVPAASRPPRPAVRPRSTVLDTSALAATGLSLPPWEDAVDRLVAGIVGR